MSGYDYDNTVQRPVVAQTILTQAAPKIKASEKEKGNFDTPEFDAAFGFSNSHSGDTVETSQEAKNEALNDASKTERGAKYIEIFEKDGKTFANGEEVKGDVIDPAQIKKFPNESELIKKMDQDVREAQQEKLHHNTGKDLAGKINSEEGDAAFGITSSTEANVPLTRQKYLTQQIDKTTAEDVMNTTQSEQGYVNYLADKAGARGTINRAAEAHIKGAPLYTATNASIKESRDIFNKNNLDQTDFNRVLTVPQAKSQMNDYFKNIPEDRKYRMQEIISAGRMNDMKALEDQMRLQMFVGASREDIDATWQKHESINRGEIGTLDTSRYILNSNKANPTEQLMALDYVNAYKADNQQQYERQQQLGSSNQSRMSGSGIGMLNLMQNARQGQREQQMDAMYYAMQQQQRQQQQQNMMMMFMMMMMMMGGGGF